MGMGCAPSLAAAGTIAAVWPDPTRVVEEAAAVEVAAHPTLGREVPETNPPMDGKAAVEVAAHPIPVVVATAQVEGPTGPSSAVVVGERAASSLAAAKERVGPMLAVVGMAAVEAAGPHQASVDAPGHAALRAAERSPGHMILLQEWRAVCGPFGDDAKWYVRPRQRGFRALSV